METTKISPELAYILGALRDGTMYIKKGKGYVHYRIEFQTKSKEWLENMRIMVKEYAANKLSIKEIPRSKGKHWRLVLNDKKFVIFLFDISGFQTPQSTWNTPKIILRSSWEIKKAYISGFFDAEGSVTKLTFHEIWNIGFVHTWRNENECPPLEDIKSMLAEIGIRSNRITVRTKNKKTPLFCFRITNKDSVQKFCNEFQSFNPEKKKRMRIINLSH